MMKAHPGFVLRNVAGEHLLLPAGANAKNYDGAVVMNGPAAFVWEKLQSGTTERALLDALLAEYDVDEATAAEDLAKLLEQFRAARVIEE